MKALILGLGLFFSVASSAKDFKTEVTKEYMAQLAQSFKKIKTVADLNQRASKMIPADQMKELVDFLKKEGVNEKDLLKIVFDREAAGIYGLTINNSAVQGVLIKNGMLTVNGKEWRPDLNLTALKNILALKEAMSKSSVSQRLFELALPRAEAILQALGAIWGIGALGYEILCVGPWLPEIYLPAYIKGRIVMKCTAEAIFWPGVMARIAFAKDIQGPLLLSDYNCSPHVKAEFVSGDGKLISQTVAYGKDNTGKVVPKGNLKFLLADKDGKTQAQETWFFKDGWSVNQVQTLGEKAEMIDIKNEDEQKQMATSIQQVAQLCADKKTDELNEMVQKTMRILPTLPGGAGSTKETKK